MAKIDIISLTGLTAVDGSEVISGATIKFETVFHVGTTDIEIRLKIFRTRQLFESKYRPIEVVELPNDFIIGVDEETFYTITPSVIYELVKDHLNNLLNGNYFEIIIE